MTGQTQVRVGIFEQKTDDISEIFVSERLNFDLIINLNDWIQIVFLPPEGKSRGELLFKLRREDQDTLHPGEPRIENDQLIHEVGLRSREDRNQNEFFIAGPVGYDVMMNLRHTTCTVCLPEEGDGTITFQYDGEKPIKRSKPINSSISSDIRR